MINFWPAISLHPINARYHNTTFGLSSIELMVVLLLISLLYSTARFSLEIHLTNQERERWLGNIETVLKIAQQIAIADLTVVTICPSKDGQSCHQHWEHGLLLLAKSTKLFFPLELRHGVVLVNRNKINFYPNMLTYSNCSFKYLPNNATVKLTKTYVLNQGGRLKRVF